MKSKKDLLLSVLYVAVFAVVYFYLKNSGLWERYRWKGLMFGAAWAVIYVPLRKDDGNYNLGLRIAIGFCLGGIIVLLHFLTQRGDSDHGFLAAMCLGFAAQGLYAHHNARKLTMQSKTSVP